MRITVQDVIDAALAPVKALLDNPPRVRGMRRAAARREKFAPRYERLGHLVWVAGKPDKEGNPTRVQVTRFQVVRV